jgi:hypothetical protein
MSIIGATNSISRALAISKKLLDLCQNVRDKEIKRLLADLSLELAEAKIRISDLKEENSHLKKRIKALDSIKGAPCPRCNQKGLKIVSSSPDMIFGVLGDVRRTHQCSLCGFTENRIVSP